MKREPVALIELVKVVVNAALIWVVVMGIWAMSDAQQAATLALAMAVVNLGGAIWQRSQVTPVADPRDNAGRRLTP